jgi:diguanylate cyclase (GGDEF)-like protein
MTGKRVRVLLVDGRAEDSLWVNELLAELEECRFGGGWVQGLEMFPVERLSDALLLVSSGSGEPFDAVVLNPELPDSYGLHTLLRIQAEAPDLPVIILSDTDDPDLAISMVRAGAQDYLAKPQLDTAPLARALRLAIERNRIHRDLREQTWREDLTGLYNRRGFAALAERDLLAGRRLGLHVALLVVELTKLDAIGFAYGKDEQQLALLDCAEVLRIALGSETNVARVDTATFALTVLCSGAGDLAEIEMAIRRQLHLLQARPNRSMLAARLQVVWSDPSAIESIEQLLETAAAQGLCENREHVPAAFETTASANRTRRHL